MAPVSIVGIGSIAMASNIHKIDTGVCDWYLDTRASHRKMFNEVPNCRNCTNLAQAE